MSSEAANRLLIVEDDEAMQRQLRWSFDQYELSFAADRDSAIAAVRRYEPRVVLLDLGLPPQPDGVAEGLRTLEEILQLAPYTKVIVATGHGDEDNAVRAIHAGAYDFHAKPVDTDLLGLLIDRALYVGALEQQNRRYRDLSASPVQGLVASSESMRQLLRQLEKIAPTNASVLLLGDTGTGKEVMAGALHRLSSRAAQPFVAINCAAIPENLLESELFGHEKGAFTGASRRSQGKIEMAEGGTLFLDEIGDMQASLQAKLLRFLQERVIERVGGRESISVNVRVICATHRNLGQMIESGAFREDLYYRIAEISLDIPALKEREGDAVLLAKHFFERAAAANGKTLRGLSPEALRAIGQYSWPGNVRELEHRINRGVIMSDGPRVTAADLGLSEGGGDDEEQTPMPLNLRVVRDTAERQAVERSLAASEGNISQAARTLGISRPALYDLMRKHELQ